MTPQTRSEQPVGDSAQERHWFVQESGEGGRYLRVHAHHMTVDEETADLRFHNADGSVFAEFLGGTWSFMEHGDPAL
jgi:hypothetical protein